MTDAPKQPSRKDRSLRNLRFMEGSQLRTVFLAMTIGLIVSTVLLWNVMSMVGENLRRIAINDPAFADLISQVQGAISSVLAIGIICNMSSAIMALIFGLMIGHRFYGPQVPLTRHLKQLAEGKYSSRVELRPGDELMQLMLKQNELAIELEKKYGKGT